MTDGLPPGWVSAPLDSLCERFRGVSYRQSDASLKPKAGYLPILRANNIQNDSVTFTNLVWVPAYRVSDQQLVRKGDVLIAMSSGSKQVVGKTAQAQDDWSGAFGAFCGVLRPLSLIDSRAGTPEVILIASGSEVSVVVPGDLSNVADTRQMVREFGRCSWGSGYSCE
jgi:hypothetical protein